MLFLSITAVSTFFIAIILICVLTYISCVKNDNKGQHKKTVKKMAKN